MEEERSLHPGKSHPWRWKNLSSLQNPKRGDLLRRPAPPPWAPLAEMFVCRCRWGLQKLGLWRQSQGEARGWLHGDSLKRGHCGK